SGDPGGSRSGGHVEVTVLRHGSPAPTTRTGTGNRQQTTGNGTVDCAAACAGWLRWTPCSARRTEPSEEAARARGGIESRCPRRGGCVFTSETRRSRFALRALATPVVSWVAVLKEVGRLPSAHRNLLSGRRQLWRRECPPCTSLDHREPREVSTTLPASCAGETRSREAFGDDHNHNHNRIDMSCGGAGSASQGTELQSARCDPAAPLARMLAQESSTASPPPPQASDETNSGPRPYALCPGLHSRPPAAISSPTDRLSDGQEMSEHPERKSQTYTIAIPLYSPPRLVQQTLARAKSLPGQAYRAVFPGPGPTLAPQLPALRTRIIPLSRPEAAGAKTHVEPSLRRKDPKDRHDLVGPSELVIQMASGECYSVNIRSQRRPKLPPPVPETDPELQRILDTII
ncbi:uncharacterized protein BJ171DRAFT_157807, partial [Polychytrium aggregatum]|uniref:uncharacterized protein n=1 Tax=Polychytrium aggregatum TaxID=110093 RepID=UPI0022FE3D76